MPIPLTPLRAWAVEVLRSTGLDAGSAEETADVLLYAERRGLATHGLIRLRVYVQRLRAGGIATDATPTILAELGGLVLVDARDAIGAATGRFAADLAVQRARGHGLALVIARDANHFGAAGYYSNLIADAGLFALVACNTDSAMCPPGGGAGVLGTNPIALAPPVPRAQRPQLDMATTEVALGKLLVAERDGRAIPEGWAVDAAGRPTTDAREGVAGALLPASGPKGFGLAFMVDALLALGGARPSPAVGRMYGDPAEPQRLGIAMLAIRADALVAAEDYQASIRDLVAEVRAAGLGAPALFPGEPEVRHENAAGEAVDLPDTALDDLRLLGAEAGVPFPDEAP